MDPLEVETDEYPSSPESGRVGDMGLFAFIIGFFRPFFGHGFNWWFSLIFTYVLGSGFFADYETARERINSLQSLVVMPEEFPLWLIIVPFAAWVVLRIAWSEGAKTLHAARLKFDEPYIEYSVPLFGNRTVLVSTTYSTDDSPGEAHVQREQIGSNDIAKIVVRNCPYDLENGRDIRDAYVTCSIYEYETQNLLFNFDYPRWGENPKPGYEGNPSDHFPTEWSRRTLAANMDRNTVDFALKSFDEDTAFAFRGPSQLRRNWKDQRLQVPPGKYLVRLLIRGVGLRKAGSIWLELLNPGAGGSLAIARSSKRIRNRWFGI